MKLINLFLLATASIFILSSNSLNSSDGINFSSSKFAEAKAEAKRTNKMVFIDGYTAWCKPCKKMSAQVFTQKEVGEYFNSNFVNLKVDMEETDGMLISRRYNVNFYPTLLFITPEGKLIQKAEGYHTKSQLLRLAKDVVKMK